jgi:hypothetical protein
VEVVAGVAGVVEGGGATAEDLVVAEDRSSGSLDALVSRFFLSVAYTWKKSNGSSESGSESESPAGCPTLTTCTMCASAISSMWAEGMRLSILQGRCGGASRVKETCCDGVTAS